MIMRILEHCMDCGAKVYTIKDGYELGDNIQSKILAFAFGLSAEIERNLISQQTKEALAMRRAAGMTLGRPIGSKNKRKKLDGKSEEIGKMLKLGMPKIRIANRLKVSVPTLYDFITAQSRQILTKVRF
jgi:DNA invertase Pin-like site-specific DNA recombinase